MAKQKEDPKQIAAGEQPASLTLRDAVLETLLQLHIDFCALGRIDEAGPLLHELMELAYYAQTGKKPKRGRKTTPTALN